MLLQFVRVSVCVVYLDWFFQPVIMPYNEHMIAQNLSQMLKTRFPVVSELHICDKSAALSASWPHGHIFFLITFKFYLFSYFCFIFRLGWVFWLIFVRAIVMASCWEKKAQAPLLLITGCRYSHLQHCRRFSGTIPCSFSSEQTKVSCCNVSVSTVAYRWGLQLKKENNWATRPC